MTQDKHTLELPGQISTRTSGTPMAFRLGFLGRWGAWIVLLVSLLTSLATWYIVRGEVTKRAQARFYFQVKAIETGIHERLKAYELMLLGGVGLFEAFDEVTREDWRVYVKTLRIDQHYPGIQGVGFSRRILPTEKAAHLRQLRSEGFPQYTIKPDGERSEYTSIIFLEPFDWRNQRAFGYDMFSDATRKEAMIRARDTGTTALSGKVTLVQETDKDVQTGFLIYMAVYRKGEPLGTPEQRRNALRGYVYSPFRMNDFMQGIVAGNEARVKLQIFDGDKPLKETLLYHSSIVEKPQHSPEDRHFATHQSILEYAGHRWVLDFVTSKYFEEQIETGLTTFILLLGITISMLLFGMVLSLTRSRSQAIALANTTADLGKANIGLREEITERKRAEDELKNMARFPSENPNPVLRISKEGTLLYMNQAGFSLLPELHLQVGQAAPLKLQDAVHQAISNSSTQRLELELGQRLFSFILGPVVAAGYVNLYADDITERKRAANALDEEHMRLRQALDEVRTLRGIVPICANCKKIRDDKGFWNQVEKYVSEHTEAEFSHGICPDCAKELYPEIYKEKKMNDMERSVILLVDDEEDFRMIFIRRIKQILKDHDFEFIEASDGEEALELLKGGVKPSIIILDYAMPKISGMELLRRIDSDHHDLYDVPRIMISGYAPKEIISEAQALRCVFFEKDMDNIFYQRICQYMTNILVDLAHKKRGQPVIG